MQSKSLLIAIAAFAVTATGAQAYVGTKYFGEAGLSVEQVQAFNQARELRRQGDLDKARDVLLSAGVAEDTLVSLRRATSLAHGAVYQAVEDGDFAAFREAVVGTPLEAAITTEADFALFSQAHELKLAGKSTEAAAILEELNVPVPALMGHRGAGRNQHHFLELSEEQHDALRAARQANDQKTVSAILKEAGIDEGALHERREKRDSEHRGQW